MANKKVTELTELTAPDADDLLHIIETPAGTAANKKVSVINLRNAIDLTLFGTGTAAWTAAITEIVSQGGGALLIPPGTETTVDAALPELSLRTGYDGGFLAPCSRSVEIVAFGAKINFTGSGSMLNLQGTTINADDPRRFAVIGGTWIGSASGEAIVKGRDMNRFVWQPEIITNMTTGGGALIQNNWNWSENMSFSGPYGATATFVDCLYDFQLQGAVAAAAYEGSAMNGGGESMARLVAEHIQHGTATNGPVNNRVAIVKGNWYDGEFKGVRGNMINRNAGQTKGTTALVEITGNMARTKISQFRFEGASDAAGATAHILSASGYTDPDQYPEIEHGTLTWTGGYALPFTGFEASESFKNQINVALTQSENNLAPTGIEYCDWIVFTADGDYSVTGITGGYSGRKLRLSNRSGQTITLPNASGSSDAVNRYDFGSDIILYDNASVDIAYETEGANRWTANGVFYGDNNLSSSGTTGGAASAGAGNQYIELDIGGTIYKVLHDGTV